MDSKEDLPAPREGRSYGVPARRARIIELLTEAYARDDLEQHEFERRIEQADQAHTIEELDALVADFPAQMVRAIDAKAPAESAERLAGNALEQEVARLDGLPAPTTFNLIGDRHVVVRPSDPRVVRSVSVIGDCSVDLRALAGASGVVLVKVAALIGDTKIIVSRGTQADIRLVGLIGDQKRVRRGGAFVKRLARKFGMLDEPSDPAAVRPGPAVVVTGFRLIGDTLIVEE